MCWLKKQKVPEQFNGMAKDPRFLTLKNIPKSDSLIKGDTIITGSYSLSFPPGHMVGTVAEIIQDQVHQFLCFKNKNRS